jgi:hypothetical protein
MTWMVWYNALMRYYSGLNLENIPKMTIWQFVQSVKNMGWLEQQAESAARRRQPVDVLYGMRRGEVPKIQNIREEARRINPNLIIPKE